jgi:hypothetical protein
MRRRNTDNICRNSEGARTIERKCVDFNFSEELGVNEFLMEWEQTSRYYDKIIRWSTSSTVQDEVNQSIQVEYFRYLRR